MGDTDTSIANGLAQADRLLAIDSKLGPGTLLMTRLDGEDAISRCFLYRIEVVATVSDASVEALLGEPVTLWLTSDGAEGRRPIHGHVRSVAGLGRDAHGHRRFEMEVVPRLWFLSCTCDCRIFQHLSVPDILRAVFTEQGLTHVAFRVVQEKYPRLDYCVQYEESALDFVSRLMEHLGMFYWHEHTADMHMLVIGDRNEATGRCDPPSVSLSVNRQAGEIQTLDFRSTFRPGKWTLNDYDFQSPTKRLLVDTPTTLDVPRMRSHEIYRWAGEFTQQDNGRALSRIRMEMEEARHRVVSGTGHCVGFDPGRRVSIARAWDDLNKDYLLTEVRHHATAPGLEAGAPAYSYANEFVAIAATTPFRPPLVTRKPIMRGPQTATVVGPPGQSIFCDPFGRVRVQFHWDRLGQRNERSSCWMRVSQTRAGSFYGSLTIPHVGHEVIVGFLEGDPDRPLITGSVANALTMPPVELPFDKDKTIQRDHGDNRMIMQGKPGQEHLSLVSPRRINTFVARQGARPLSAWGETYANDTQPYQFNNNLIDTFQDPMGLYEVWEGWYRLNNPNSPTIPLPPNLPPGFDGTTADDLGNESGSILKYTPASKNYTASTSTTTPGTSSGATVTTTTTTPSSSKSVSPPAPGSSAPGTVTTTTTTTTTGTTKTTTTETDTVSNMTTGAGVDDKVEECDINSFTTGRNNAVSLGNKNTWVWADNNTWVNGYSYTHVILDTHSEVNGSTYSVVHGDTHAQVDGNTDSHVNGDTQSTIDGTSTSTILAGQLSTVLVEAWSIVVGARISFTAGISESWVLGERVSINMLGNQTINFPSKSETSGTNIETIEININQVVIHQHSTGIKVEESETHIEEPGDYVGAPTTYALV